MMITIDNKTYILTADECHYLDIETICSTLVTDRSYSYEEALAIYNEFTK